MGASFGFSTRMIEGKTSSFSTTRARQGRWLVVWLVWSRQVRGVMVAAPWTATSSTPSPELDHSNLGHHVHDDQHTAGPEAAPGARLNHFHRALGDAQEAKSEASVSSHH